MPHFIDSLDISEYHPYQAHYINLLQDRDPLSYLPVQTDMEVQMISEISADRLGYSYAAGKWTIAEVWLHIIDTERVMAHRAHWIARGLKDSLPGFHQDDCAQYAPASHYAKQDLIDELKTVRQSTIQLYKHLPAERLRAVGEVSGAGMSVRALLGVISGHSLHHQAVLQERYQ